jgi:hypothetical protein
MIGSSTFALDTHDLVHVSLAHLGTAQEVRFGTAGDHTRRLPLDHGRGAFALARAATHGFIARASREVLITDQPGNTEAYRKMIVLNIVAWVNTVIVPVRARTGHGVEHGLRSNGGALIRQTREDDVLAKRSCPSMTPPPTPSGMSLPWMGPRRSRGSRTVRARRPR